LLIAGGTTKISGLAIAPDRRGHILPTHSRPLSRRSPWSLIAGDATRRRPCDGRRPPKTDPFPHSSTPAILEQHTQIANRRRISQISGLTVPPDSRRHILPTHPAAIPEAFTLVAHRPRASQISRRLSTRSPQRYPSHPFPGHSRGIHPIRPSMGHIPTQRPCDSRRQPKSDPFPPTPQLARHPPWLLNAGERHKPAALLYNPTAADRSFPPIPCHPLAPDRSCYRRRTPQISGLAIPPDRRMQILPTHSLPRPRHSPSSPIDGAYPKSAALHHRRTAEDRCYPPAPTPQAPNQVAHPPRTPQVSGPATAQDRRR
jgi:hypothetical protein